MGNGSARRRQARYERGRRRAEKASDPVGGAKQTAARESQAKDSVRLFLALDLPEHVRKGIEAWQQRALGDPALRPVSAAGLHITLSFLGNHPERAISRIAEILARTEPRPVELRFDADPVPVPGGRPNLYALGASGEQAVELQSELAEPLLAEGFAKPEKRRFWPHVTVARVRSERLPPAAGERRGRQRPKRVAEHPRALPRELTEPFGAVRVALYRSKLKPEGAEYEFLAGVDLPSPAGDRRGDEEDG